MDKKFEEVYKKYYDQLFTLAIRVTGEQASAEDVLQEAFLNALKAWGKFEQRSSYYTWLYAIVLNSAKKFIKEERPLPVDKYAEEHNMSIESVYEYIEGFGELPDEHTIVNQVRESCLQMFLNCLPSNYRVVYTLRVILSCSVKESSQILDISENSVKIRLSRAKEILREHFKGRCSLISKNGKCNCRSFAAHVRSTGKDGIMFNKDIIQKNEKLASLKFKNDLKDVLEVDDLYDTQFHPIPFEQLKKRVAKLIDDKQNSLLS